MDKFNYTNPNSSILEAFTDEWPEPVADIEADVDYDMAEDEVYTNAEEAALEECDKVQECDGKDCEDKKPLDEAKDEEEAEEEVEEETTEEAEEIEDNGEVEDTEVEAEETEEEVEEPSNISTDDFLAQIRTVFDDNMNKLDDVPEEDQEKFASFNDGLNRAFDLIKEFLQPADEEEQEIEEIETAEEPTGEVAEVDAEVAPEEVVGAEEVKFEFPEDEAVIIA